VSVNDSVSSGAVANLHSCRGSAGAQKSHPAVYAVLACDNAHILFVAKQHFML